MLVGNAFSFILGGHLNDLYAFAILFLGVFHSISLSDRIVSHNDCQLMNIE